MQAQAQTPQEFFNKILPARFKAEKAAGVDVVAQVNISGPEGSNWTVTVKDQKITVTEGVHPNPS